MKKLLIASLLFASTAQAAVSVERIEYCQSVSGLAKSVMKARQQPVSMDKMMEVDPSNEMMQILIRNAYSKPFYHSVNNKLIVESNFASEVMIGCLGNR